MQSSLRNGLLGLILLVYLPSFAQITVNVKGANNRMLYLQSFSLSGYQKIDSARVISGRLVYNPKADLHPGMYAIGDSKYSFQFIVKEPEIEFTTCWPQLQDSLKVVRSKENLIYQNYLKFRDDSYLKLETLNQLLSVYSPSDSFYHTALAEFVLVQSGLAKWTDSVNRLNPDSYVARYINADQKPAIAPGLNIVAQKSFFREHWFDKVDWSDNSIMSSDVLTSKITSYLGLYSNPNIGKAELSQGFMIAVDHILPLAKQNPDVYNFTLKYLIRGFERYGFDDVILHIATNYSAPEQCENEQQSETIARLEKYKLLAPGKIAPEISMNDINGRNLKLSSIKGEKLLVFWASWCPHCQQLLPQIVSWSQQPQYAGIRVIPISLDEDKSALQKAIEDLRIPWPVLVDYKKWNSQAAVDYNIYATPVMILLDSGNRILAKPMNLNELVESAR
ncbi:MAG: redoxin domain-containing protein [Bacteroidales bacterium]|nr:redoxin domain-containing protein [Bacteroidales bacterium]